MGAVAVRGAAPHSTQNCCFPFAAGSFLTRWLAFPNTFQYPTPTFQFCMPGTGSAFQCNASRDCRIKFDNDWGGGVRWGCYLATGLHARMDLGSVNSEYRPPDHSILHRPVTCAMTGHRKRACDSAIPRPPSDIALISQPGWIWAREWASK